MLRSKQHALPESAVRVLVALAGADPWDPLLGTSVATRHVRSIVPAIITSVAGRPA